MANPSHALKDNFEFNIQIAKALVPLTKFEDKPNLQAWISKLEHMVPEGDITDMANRNMYTWFLLMVLQERKPLVIPFTSPPPPGDLLPLTDVVPKDLYENVLGSIQNNTTWTEDLVNASSVSDSNLASHIHRMAPRNFFARQPKPHDGVVVYGSVFSEGPYD